MHTLTRSRPRRLFGVALVTLVLATIFVAGAASAQSVTPADLDAAEQQAEEAERRLAEERSLLAETEGTRDRLRATLSRLASRERVTKEQASSQADALRERIARMYMIAQRGQGVVVSDVGSFSARVAYLAAISDSDRDTLSLLAFTAADISGLQDSAQRQLEAVEARIVTLEKRVAELDETAGDARSHLAEVRATWQRQEAARIAAEEAELRRQEAALAAQLAASSSTTTTTSPTGSTTSTTRPSYGHNPSQGAEQWRSMVTEVFAKWGLDKEKCANRNGVEFCVDAQIDNAMRVMACESNGVPFAENPRSGAAGLFQHLPYYWPFRRDRVRALHPYAGLPADASYWNPEHNAIVAALLVWESRETLLGNRGGGGVRPAVWPEFNWDRYESSGYGYSAWGKGPGPWGHWTCGRKVAAYDLSWVHPWAEQQSAS